MSDASELKFAVSAEFDMLAGRAVADAVAQHHASGRATCHGDGDGLYLLFPDKSTRHFPAESFPMDKLAPTPYWLKWCEFIQALYRLLTPVEWAAVQVQYSREGAHGPFQAVVAPDGLDVKHWLAARELASRISAEHRTEQQYLA